MRQTLLKRKQQEQEELQRQSEAMLEEVRALEGKVERPLTKQVRMAALRNLGRGVLVV